MPFIDFAALREAVPIDSVASILPLKWKQEGNQLRATCPHHGGERGLAITPEKGLFVCMATSKGGDCISLYAHVNGCTMFQAAQALQEEFGTVPNRTIPNGTVSKERATVPQKPEGRTEKSQPASAPSFDPEKFAEKLCYSDEVAALGISEDDAERLGVGFHSQRKSVYFPVRNPDHSISGYIGIKDGQAKMPPKWLPGSPNVKRLRSA